jgi:hypothetical protein
MYRAATDDCPWPNMDCIRPNDIKPDAFVIENGIESLDPAKMNPQYGISTLGKPNLGASFATGGWYEYPEEDPTGIPTDLCVVSNGKGHWGWQPKERMPLDMFKVLMLTVEPKMIPE